LKVAGGEFGQGPGGVAWPLFTGLGPVGALPTAPRLARMFTEMALRGWGLSAVEDNAILVVSEFTTNVVRAATGPDGSPLYDGDGLLPVCWLRLMADADVLAVEVWDTLPAARGGPVPRVPTSDDESGRGLSIVGALSLTWGWEPVPGLRAKRTWAVLDVHAEPEGQLAV
jgi:hypothetical protein